MTWLVIALIICDVGYAIGMVFFSLKVVKRLRRGGVAHPTPIIAAATGVFILTLITIRVLNVI
jgi:hypothetical protein